jgi:hypothetical protein
MRLAGLAFLTLLRSLTIEDLFALQAERYEKYGEFSQ